MESQNANIRQYFEGLNFNEEKHIYTVKEQQLPSVSGLIKNFHEQFDEQKVSLSVSIRTGVPQEEILAEWEHERVTACDTGHRVHLFGELYPFNRELKPMCKQEEAIVKFWDSIPEHIIPVFTELRMYHKDFQFAGTADIILFDTIKKGYIIGDYKTNKDLFKNFKKKTMFSPFNHLLESPYSKYTLQLSFYQLLFEQTGYKILSRKLIWLLKTGEFLLYDTDDYSKTLSKYLISRN